MRRLLPFLFMAVFLSLGCKQAEKKDEIRKDATSHPKEETAPNGQENVGGNRIVARINGKPIYRRDLRGMPLKSFIIDEILYQEGLRRGLDKELEKRVEDYKRGLIVNSIKSEILANLPKEGVTDEDIEKYYKENEDNYTYIRVQEVSVGDRETADEIHKKALSGEDFEKIKSEYSNSGKQVIVTDLKFADSKMYRDLFDKKEVGSISGVIQDGNRFKILKITDVKKIPLEKARNVIMHTITARRRGQALEEYVERLKKENNIKVEILSGDKGNEGD